jgi:phosphoenolpyruvate carboxykinase (ATP)
MLAERMRTHEAQAWLINTGWSGGGYGTGSRIALAYTRAIIDAIHDGTLNDCPTVEDPIFGLAVPERVPRVPEGILRPHEAWTDHAAYHRSARKLAHLFHQNFQQYADVASAGIAAAGPKTDVTARKSEVRA